MLPKKPPFEEIKKAVVEKWPDAKVTQEGDFLTVITDLLEEQSGDPNLFRFNIVADYLADYFKCPTCGASPFFGIISVYTRKEKMEFETAYYD